MPRSGLSSPLVLAPLLACVPVAGSDDGSSSGAATTAIGGSVGDGSGDVETAAVTAASFDPSTGPGATTDTPGGSSSSAGETGPGDAHVPDGVLFFDDFEYVVEREMPDKFGPDSPFVAHGWSWGKDAVAGGTGAGGWLYTADAIPGYAGAMPGVGSSRVLVVQSGAGSYAGVIQDAWRQTDFYLQYGDPASGALDTIPADVWFQQWIYLADSPEQPSLVPPTTRVGKWIYPTRNDYPSTDLGWLVSLTGVMVDSEVADQGSSAEIDIGVRSLGFELNLSDTDNDLYTDDRPYATGELGHCGSDPAHTTALDANRWWLVRMHIDHTAEIGVVQFSIRTQGGEWIDIVDTTTSGFVEWQPTSAEGHRGLRFPTTMNNWYQDPVNMTTHGDWWIYVDDFAMAAGVNAGGQGADDLPQYTE